MAVVYGIIASFFFSLTFVLNEAMHASGGNWLWTASLRFLFMFPFFFLFVIGKKGDLKIVLNKLAEQPIRWFLWSQIGFGAFYIPLTYASTLAPGWLIASTWQITIVAGAISAPFLTRNQQQKKAGRMTIHDGIAFILILMGIILIEQKQLFVQSGNQSILAFLFVLVAAFAYPIGNRKIMQVNQEGANELTTTQRIFAMLLCSLPTWLLCALLGYTKEGLPTDTQVLSSFVVAVSSGVVATFLFFYATQRVQNHLSKLATIEATQSLEVLFSLVLGIIFLNTPLPSFVAMVGVVLIIVGVVYKIRT